jgi:transposase
MPMIGPVTALGFVAPLDDCTRFATAHEVEAYLGLVPSEHSSGEQQHGGRITKRGDSRTRWLLVEAAWRIRRSKDPALAALNAWADGILYAMWRHNTPYAAARVHAPSPATAAA